MIESFTVYTSDLKEAYSFATMLNITEGIFDVSVRPMHNSEYYIGFSKEPGADLGKHILNIAEEFEFHGLNFNEDYWSKLL